MRDLLLHQGHLAPRAEALLFAADRAHHVASVIRPALARGAVVVTDRYVDSSVAYQGAGRDLGADEVRQLSSWATADLVPDLTVVLDLSAEDARRRRGEGCWVRTGSRPSRTTSTTGSGSASWSSPRPSRGAISSSTPPRCPSTCRTRCARDWPPCCPRRPSSEPSARRSRPNAYGARPSSLLRRPPRPRRRPSGSPRRSRRAQAEADRLAREQTEREALLQAQLAADLERAAREERERHEQAVLAQAAQEQAARDDALRAQAALEQQERELREQQEAEMAWLDRDSRERAAAATRELPIVLARRRGDPAGRPTRRAAGPRGPAGRADPADRRTRGGRSRRPSWRKRSSRSAPTRRTEPAPMSSDDRDGDRGGTGRRGLGRRGRPGTGRPRPAHGGLGRRGRSSGSRSASGMTHAWLFTGPPGSGRSVAARAFAAALQCRDGGCGECHECRTALAGTHADVTVIATELLSIKTEQARELVQLAARRPTMGRWRVIIIEDADRLTETAADALLKAIEEPPARTVWMLVRAEPGGRDRHDPQPLPAPGAAHPVDRRGGRPAGPAGRHRPGHGGLRRARGPEPHRPGPAAGPRRGRPDPAA